MATLVSDDKLTAQSNISTEVTQLCKVILQQSLIELSIWLVRDLSTLQNKTP